MKKLKKLWAVVCRAWTGEKPAALELRTPPPVRCANYFDHRFKWHKGWKAYCCKVCHLLDRKPRYVS